ncbi:MAG: hypothetical protein FWF24_06070 [Alphaproteobacteria bacterium]|nr:hypothetical protein [Alphaproteobacteria bacterium]
MFIAPTVSSVTLAKTITSQSAEVGKVLCFRFQREGGVKCESVAFVPYDRKGLPDFAQAYQLTSLPKGNDLHDVEKRTPSLCRRPELPASFIHAAQKAWPALVA